MGIAQKFEKEKLIIGLLFSQMQLEEAAKQKLQKFFGPIDSESPAEDFSRYSSYYNEEIGSSVLRKIISFKELVNPEQLAAIKAQTNALELEFAKEGRRPVNIDPGILSSGRFALATTKNAGHRLPLQQGIYIEMTLFYSRKSWQNLPWTYPDFQSPALKEALSRIRRLYMAQRKAQA